jgi:hypothetical protein
MTNLDGIPFKFELVTIDVNVQVKVFVFIPFPIDEKTALRVPFAELGFEQIHCLPKGDRLQIIGTRHEDNPLDLAVCGVEEPRRAADYTIIEGNFPLL